MDSNRILEGFLLLASLVFVLSVGDLIRYEIMKTPVKHPPPRPQEQPPKQ